MTDDIYLTLTTNHSHLEVYHTSKKCPRVTDPDRLQERTERYVEWHDLEKCQHCPN